jgi:hypothetical protein
VSSGPTTFWCVDASDCLGSKAPMTAKIEKSDQPRKLAGMIK